MSDDDRQDAGSKDARDTPPALPPDPGGAGVPAGLSGADEAVGEVHRTDDARGQGPKPNERLEAR